VAIDKSIVILGSGNSALRNRQERGERERERERESESASAIEARTAG
jgi:hypothetical protein